MAETLPPTAPLFVRGLPAKVRRELQRQARDADTTEAELVRTILTAHTERATKRRRAAR